MLRLRPRKCAVQLKSEIPIKPELIWEICQGGLLESGCFCKTLIQCFKKNISEIQNHSICNKKNVLSPNWCNQGFFCPNPNFLKNISLILVICWKSRFCHSSFGMRKKISRCLNTQSQALSAVQEFVQINPRTEKRKCKGLGK